MKYKKLTAVLMGMLCMFVPLTGTAPEQMTISVSAEAYPFNTNCSYIYDSLNAEQKAVYDELLDVCAQVDESTETYACIPWITTKNFTLSEMIVLSSLFSFDHPEFFWLSPSYQATQSERSVSFTLKLYSQYQDGTVRQETRQKLLAIEQEYIRQAMAYDTDYERAEYLLKQLKQDIAFGYGEENIDQSIASALLDNTTVCAGYARLYSLLCNAMGIDTISEISLNHAWNVLKIGDNWYNADINQQLFLLSESELRAVDEAIGIRTAEVNGETVSFYMHEPYEGYYTFALPDTGQPYEKPLSTGDINGDGEIDIRDVIMINKAIFGKISLTDEQNKAADINRDGMPDASDSLEIMKYIVRLTESLHV